jgi:predicted nucleic acid-binding protein
MVITPLHRAEWAHAVARAASLYGISVKELHVVAKDFERDCRSGLWKEVGLPEMAFQRCIHLAERYAARLNCGTLDTLHVASALDLGGERFLTFDQGQEKLARAVGLKV